MDYYFTIEKTGSAEYKDRGSRFIALVYPLTTPESFKPILDAVKKEHPKAVHHCFAYRLGITGDQFRANDDGEPSGSAGKPILGQIDSKKLTDVCVVVVRYFGGTLLGVPGLINAYKTATSLALQMIPTVQKPVLNHYEIEFDYLVTNEVMMVVKQLGCQVIKSELQLFSKMQIGVPRMKEEQALFKLSEIKNINIKKI